MALKSRVSRITAADFCAFVAAVVSLPVCNPEDFQPVMSQDMPTIQQEIDEVKAAVSQVLAHARQLGASSAEASMNRTRGLSVETRHGEVETMEFNQDGGLGISVYVGQRKGSASTADLSPAALKRTVEAAIDIARYTSEDP